MSIAVQEGMRGVESVMLHKALKKLSDFNLVRADILMQIILFNGITNKSNYL